MNKNPLMTADTATMKVQKALVLLAGRPAQGGGRQPQRLAIHVADLAPQPVNIRHTPGHAVQNLDTPVTFSFSTQSPLTPPILFGGQVDEMK